MEYFIFLILALLAIIIATGTPPEESD